MQVAGVRLGRIALLGLSIAAASVAIQHISNNKDQQPASSDQDKMGKPLQVQAEPGLIDAHETQNQQDSPLLKQIKIADLLNRHDLLRSHLRQQSAIAPNAPYTLFYQAYLALLEDEVPKAETLLNQMRLSSSNTELEQQLARLISLYRDKQNQLQNIRLLTAAGRLDEAVNKFDEVFPTSIPVLSLELEYLELKGRIPRYWRSVRSRLEALNQLYPNIAQLELAKANHLARNAKYLREAESTFRRLAYGESTGRRAASAWLNILESRPLNTQTLSAYQELAQRYPNDRQIQQSLKRAEVEFAEEQLRLRNPYYRAMKNGLAALDAENYRKAESLLDFAHQGRGNDPEILGGLGHIELNRGNQKLAQYYFEQALFYNRDPDRQGKWQSLVKTASYWASIKEGQRFFSAGRTESARSAFHKANRIQPDNYTGYLRLAELAASQYQDEQALHFYNQALRRNPTAKDLLNSRVEYEYQHRGLESAQRFIAQLAPSQQKQLSELEQSLQKDQQFSDLEQQLAGNNTNAALTSLSTLLQLSPLSPWDKKQIAEAFIQLGKTEQADQLMQTWAAEMPQPDMKFAYGLYLSQQGKIADAVAQLESIPDAERSPAISRNLQRIRVDLALQKIQKNNSDSPSEQELQRLAEQFRDIPEAQIRIAELWLSKGENQQARAVLDTIFIRRDWLLDTKLSYGEILLKTASFAKFERWFASISMLNYSYEDAQQLMQLQARFKFMQGEYQEREGDHLLALSNFSQASNLPGKYQTKAKIAALRNASKLKEKQAFFQQQSDLLMAQQQSLPPEDLVELASTFQQLKLKDKSAKLLAELSQRPNIDAILLRDGMLVAEQNQDWQSMESLGFSGLKLHADSTDDDYRQLYDTASDDWLSRSLKAGIDRAQEKNDGHILFGLDYNTKQGRDNYSQIPVEMLLPFPEQSGHLLARVDYVSVTSGKRDYIDPDPSGTGRLDIPFSKSDTGIALGIGWIAEHWRADIGSTPLGFDSSSWVGGLEFDSKFKSLGWSFTVSQRPETGSVLSYAGMDVPDTALTRAGKNWGGVLRTGVKLGTSFDQGKRLGIWTSFQYHQLTGDDVEDNTRLGLMGGLYWRVLNEEDRQLRIGLNGTHLAYDKNLEEFTLNHGGYYSPQRYDSISLPVRFYGRRGKDLSYLLQLSVSHSTSSLDAPYLLGGSNRSGSGFGYSVEMALEKRISDHWYLGLSADIQRADFYEPNHISLYARYTLQDRLKDIHTPPEPPSLYSSYY
ncbi:BCSC C-terminal domain-containing protein [Spongiibacter sp. KMU-158]|uniref:BCSC C-terminal domain-containing protein n=1 Tax=Spongiibacter pelagi TaxID=2760804 RepID=A0A927C0B2_9GAMM|nr:cellulose synthase subunit BcsC-related outer membrane protein [Spongiibacter pelagi]MBD2857677.1 BCSC C-terminal domain-containing protein [Spongiibacter pelagi]